MKLFIPVTASNMAEWVRKVASAVNGLLAGASKLRNLSAAPPSPEPGEIYYDTTTKKARVWDETAWRDLW